MKTYNSENLPLEHIVKSGRSVLHYKFVIKNTLAKIALANCSKDGMELKDTNIFVWGEDQLAVTKVVAKFE